MRNNLCVFSVCGIVLFVLGTNAWCGQRSTAQHFSLERYRKFIVTGNKLYNGHGQGMNTPYNGTLTVIPLESPTEHEKYPSYSGVYVEDWSEEKDSLISLSGQFQFCWDITNSTMYSLNIIERWLGGKPEFALMAIPLEWLRDSTSFRDIEPLESYGVSTLFPLYRHFSLNPFEQRSRVFFDILAVESQEYQLYISYEGYMSVRIFSPETQRFLDEHWNELSFEKRHQMLEDEWKETDRFSIEFDGPFWVFHIKQQIYIFSEVARRIYQRSESGLQLVVELPPLSELSERSLFDTAFVVDKDTGEALFFLPSYKQSKELTVLSVGGSHSQRQDILPALKAALELYTTSEK